MADNMASLQYDPFLTRVGDTAGGGGKAGNAFDTHAHEGTPLTTGELEKQGGGGEAKLMVVPSACCMMSQTVVSVVCLALAFGETGHRDGYEEGHLDEQDQASGCESLFYWLMVQAGVDLLITCFTCLFLVSPLKAEPVGVHGCCATVRLCTLAAGFHILYFSGLKRKMCNNFLVIWSTIIVWVGVGILVLLGCFLFCMLLGAAGAGGSPQGYRQPPRRNPKGAAPPPAYKTTYHPSA